MLKKTGLTLALLGSTALVNATVLTTIKPLGFIANAITDGVTQTEVLLPISASPHDYNLKPSDIEKLHSARLVVWIGSEMETFLEKSIDKLPKNKVLTLEKIEAIEQLVEAIKKDDDDDNHDHKHSDKHSHHDHDHDEDWHIWLSPKASELIAEQIANQLTQTFPEHKDKINENLTAFKTGLHSKNSDITKQLNPLKNKGYYTFHDAYNHFEQHYGLTSLGSFTINPTIAPGAKTLNTIKKSINKHKAHCLFTEPQFTPKVIESLSKGTATHIGKLDPLGEQIAMNKTAYFTFLQSIADQFSDCLSRK